MKALKNLKVGDQVKHGIYGNTLTVSVVEQTDAGLRIIYTANDGSQIENTYKGRTLNMKVRLD